MIKIFIFCIIFSDQIKDSTVEESGCGSDWISYSNKKCFKILNIKGTEAEAKAICSLLEGTSSLVTIVSKTEQNYLNEHLKSYRSIADNVWIGLEYVSSSFQWIDGTQYQYQNWGENAIKDGSNKCVQKSLIDSELGQWTDDNCYRKYVIVCQKKQSSKSVITEQVRNLTNVIDNMNKHLNDETSELKTTNKKLEGI